MVRIRVKPIESRGLLQGQQDSLERKGTQSSLRREWEDGGEVLAWRGGRKRWCTGISKKSPKTLGAGGAVPPEEATGPRLPPSF